MKLKCHCGVDISFILADSQVLKLNVKKFVELPVLIGVMLSRCHSAEVLSTTDGNTLVAVVINLEVIAGGAQLSRDIKMSLVIPQ